MVRNLIARCGAGQTLLPEGAGTIGPSMNFGDFTDGPIANHLNRDLQPSGRMMLNSHLRDDARFLSSLRKYA